MHGKKNEEKKGRSWCFESHALILKIVQDANGCVIKKIKIIIKIMIVERERCYNASKIMHLKENKDVAVLWESCIYFKNNIKIDSVKKKEKNCAMDTTPDLRLHICLES